MSERPDEGRNPGSEPAPAHHTGAHRSVVFLASALGLTLLAWAFALAGVGFAVYWVVRQTPLIGLPVSVTVDGHRETVRTARADVAGLIADLGLALRPEDSLLPAPSTPLSRDMQVTVERARPGLVSTDGRLVEVYTRKTTVGDLLKAAHIAVSRQDEVLLDGVVVPLGAALPPPQRTETRTGYPSGRRWNVPRPAPVHLSIHRAVPVTVDDGSIPYVIYTTAATLGDALLREDVTLYLGDRVQPSLGARISSGMRVTIQRSKPIIVAADGKTVQTRTRGKTVGAALMDLGVVVAGMDQVAPALREPLVDQMRIKVTRVAEVTLVDSTPIPFESISVPDDKLEIDHTRLAQAGKNGEYRKRWKVRFEDGQEVARALVDEWQAAAPVTRVQAYGRLLVPRTLETESGTVTYWRKIRMYATSYSPARSGTPRSAPWYGRTRIGMTLRKGLVAVDTSVIPFHTPLYVPGYGLALAADTGGGVRGKWIDLGYSDDDYVSWHWWVDVYVLEPHSAPAKIRWVLPNYPPASFPRKQ